MPDLRVPAEWESHEGIRVANRAVYQDETTPISYQSFRVITDGLTVSPIPKSDTVSEFGDPNPVRVYATVRKDILKERIETKIEEYAETLDTLSELDEFHFDEGMIAGLKLALQILEES